MRAFTLVAMSALVLGLVASCGEGQEPLPAVGHTAALSYDAPTAPSCGDLGTGLFSFTVAPVSDGTHAIDASSSVDITTFYGTWFNWAATLPMAAVIVPGGAGAKVYLYGPDNTAHAGLSGPTDPTTGQPYALSSLTFCYSQGLKVSVMALAKVTRTKQWTIQKSVDASEVTLAVGQSQAAQYMVAVSQTGAVDSGWSASGSVEVANPSASSALVTGVSVAIDAVPVTAVSCPVTFPATLSPGSTLACTFTTPLSDGTTRTLTASATTSGSIAGGQAAWTLDFAYASPTFQDSCVTVEDSLVGSLGSVCTSQAPKTFTYAMTLGPYAECGNTTVVNTATLTTDTTATTASSSATVNVTVPCAAGCTLTPGYWKTHSSYGPAPYDSTWASLPQGADTLFFLSGETYYDVLWTAPRGNPYFILAHAFIAAELNQKNGAATTPAMSSAFASALAFFQSSTTEVPKAMKATLVALAAILDDYNNGLIGPGHCSN